MRDQERAGTILVADDDSSVLLLVRRALSKGGFRVVEAHDGISALHMVRKEPPDLVILDWRMPGLSGLEVARRIREETEIPIIILTGLTQEEAATTALEAGADDYVRKPFGADELLARVRALLRRAAPAEAEMRFGPLQLLPEHLEATVEGRMILLTPTEYRLLEQLVRAGGRTVRHDVLLANVWGESYAEDTHVLQVTVSRLRHKLSETPVSILSASGIGYRLSESERATTWARG